MRGGARGLCSLPVAGIGLRNQDLAGDGVCPFEGVRRQSDDLCFSLKTCD